MRGSTILKQLGEVLVGFGIRWAIQIVFFGGVGFGVGYAITKGVCR